MPHWKDCACVLFLLNFVVDKDELIKETVCESSNNIVDEAREFLFMKVFEVEGEKL